MELAAGSIKSRIGAPKDGGATSSLGELPCGARERHMVLVATFTISAFTPMEELPEFGCVAILFALLEFTIPTGLHCFPFVSYLF